MFWLTFYSYKGGVGRTSAVWNVAVELARRGRTALVIDFDFEAPGAHYFVSGHDPNAVLPERSVYELLSKYSNVRGRRWKDDPSYQPEQLAEDFRSTLANAMYRVPSQAVGTHLDGEVFLLPCHGKGPSYADLRDVSIDWDRLFAGFPVDSARNEVVLDQLLAANSPGPLLFHTFRAAAEQVLAERITAIADQRSHSLNPPGARKDETAEAARQAAFLSAAYVLLDMRTGRTVASALLPSLLSDAAVVFTSHHRQSEEGIEWFCHVNRELTTIRVLSPSLYEEPPPAAQKQVGSVLPPAPKEGVHIVPFDRRLALGEAFVVLTSTGAGPAYRTLTETLIRKNKGDTSIGKEAIDEASLVVDEIAYHRETHIARLLKSLSDGSVRKTLILFGGIATKLRDATAYASWLRRHPDSRLFICHEGAESTHARVLDDRRLDDSLGSDLDIRFQKKRLEVERLRGGILAEVGLPQDDERVVFIQLLLPLTQYIMIADNDIYLSPLLERRSSESASLLLKKKAYRRGRDFRDQLYEFMLFHLQRSSQPGPERDSLVEHIRGLQRTDRDET